MRERETKREGDRASCEIFYVPARHWLAIDLCHLSGRFKVSIPDLADFKLHFSQIAYSKRAEREREVREAECELLLPVLLSALALKKNIIASAQVNFVTKYERTSLPRPSRYIRP